MQHPSSESGTRIDPAGGPWAGWLAADARRRVLLCFATAMELRGATGVSGGEAADGWWRGPIQGLGAGRVEALVTGVGKANAAAAVAWALAGVPRAERGHVAVVSVGIAGALPAAGESAVGMGSLVVAQASIWGDEGVRTPEAFIDCWAMGFPLAATAGPALASDAGLLAALAPHAESVGLVATVSTCSGTDELARAVAARTGAVAEAMEGAAVLQTALRLGSPAIEVRAISNTTGDRSGQRWDIAAALARLRRLLGPR